ncbi:MAG: MFS transporter [Hyphomonadaceae bacterium]
MILVTLAIDVVLPALPLISDTLRIESDNQRQFVIVAFIAGFALSQAFIGLLSDAWGRRGLLLASLGAYAVFSLASAFAQDLPMLLALRVAQGAAAGGTRILILAVVRDLYNGARMARVMSLATAAFIIAPVLGPAIGAMIISVASWRVIFLALGVVGCAAYLVVALRLPESLAASARRPLSLSSIGEALTLVGRDRLSVAYTGAMSFRFAGQFAFLTSVQQIFEQVFVRPDLLAPVLGSIAAVVACGALLNARFVMAIGALKMSRMANAGLIAVCAMQLVWVFAGGETLLWFFVFQAVISASASVCNATFQALAMQKMGEVAGAATSLQGSFSMLAGALMGGLAGQIFDGTLKPYAIALMFFALAAAASAAFGGADDSGT